MSKRDSAIVGAAAFYETMRMNWTDVILMSRTMPNVKKLYLYHNGAVYADATISRRRRGTPRYVEQKLIEDSRDYVLEERHKNASTITAYYIKNLNVWEKPRFPQELVPGFVFDTQFKYFDPDSHDPYAYAKETLTRDKLKELYWDKELTDEKIAKTYCVGVSFIGKLIRDYNLQKKDNGIRLRGKKGYKMPEEEKEAKRAAQPHSKPIQAVLPSTGRVVLEYQSICEASKKDGHHRGRIRDCLKNPALSHHGYNWRYKMTYGEALHYRRHEGLDMRVEFEKMQSRIRKNLPERMPRDEALRYYGYKLHQVWRADGTVQNPVLEMES